MEWRSVAEASAAAETPVIPDPLDGHGVAAVDDDGQPLPPVWTKGLKRDWGSNEFPEGADTLVVDPVNRREFMTVMGASAALAGLTLSGCIRKPKEKIVPFVKKPEDLIPGKPVYYATAAAVGPTVLGMLVESQDGRPTKIEGNPRHPGSLGATSAWAQAEVLAMYDPDRARTPSFTGASGKEWAPKSYAECYDRLDTLFSEWRRANGAGVAVLLGDNRSPTLAGVVAEIRAKMPQAKVYRHVTLASPGREQAMATLGLSGQRAVLALDKAKVMFAVDSDFLHTEGDAVANARHFAHGRRDPRQPMNRLYAAESFFTVTGTMADHRLRLPGREVGALLVAVADELFGRRGLKAPAGAEGFLAAIRGKADAARFGDGKFVSALAGDLATNAGAAVVVVGDRQPAWAHVLGFIINDALKAHGATVRFVADAAHIADAGDIGALAAALKSGAVKSVVVLDANPVYDAPADADFAAAFAKAENRVVASMLPHETARAATWHVPLSHFLESWGDVAASDGTWSVTQPLIAPLFDTPSIIEFAARLAGLTAPVAGMGIMAGYDLVRQTFAHRLGLHGDAFESAWRDLLHVGALVPAPAATVVTEPRFGNASAFGAIAAAALGSPASGLEVHFAASPALYDGRYANNGWLQELPDPITKLTWDNAALVSPKTARALGVYNSAENSAKTPVATISLGGKSIDIGVWTTPGVADDVVVLPLGYGRTHGGAVADGAGVSAYPLRTSAAPWFASGGSLTKTRRTADLASTQTHGRMDVPARLIDFKPRAMVRQADQEAFRQNPTFVQDLEARDPHDPKKPFVARTLLWTPPNQTTGTQWGMSIDLNACTGCNACTVACQAENNIPVVGRSQVANGREMHWIRMDRYFTGPEDDPRAVQQPVACMQCENAPCESVCPVAATSHSPDGLNDIAYNRCIGTRYCANNCPYKVRRFNFFNYQKDNEQANPLLKMQRNPDVTVRFRGVIEKCTYCVQRIRQAQIEAHVHGVEAPADGVVVPACAQACPTQAIVMGDINDPKSAVSAAKRDSRNYVLLNEINVQPRTSYLARIRNPHPELA